jgi:hypothetical protein
VTRVSPQDAPGQVDGPKTDDEHYLSEDLPLDPFDDGPGDDTEALELDVGVAIDELEDGGENQASDEIDLGQMLNLDADDAEDPLDDVPLPIDLTQGLELRESPLEREGEESVDEGPIALDESKLPELDRDDGGEEIALEASDLTLASADEAGLPRAAEPWQLLTPTAPLEACNSLVAAGEHVVGASSDLLWFANGADAPLRLAVDHASVSSLILLGAQDDLAIAATRGSKLWRRARQASQAVQLVRSLDTGDALARRRRGFELARPYPALPDEFWLHAGDGTLRRSVDAGDHFAPVELPGNVVTLATGGAPVVLVERDQARMLAIRGADGFEVRALTGFALAAAKTSKPLLAAEREIVALAAPQSAVLLSVDGGQSFRSVAGTAGATALCIARFRERDRLWVAIYREATDQTLIALVDVDHAQAECVAVLSNDESDSGDPAERGEWARVSALAWHAPSSRLWAAGGFGLRSLIPLE